MPFFCSKTKHHSIYYLKEVYMDENIFGYFPLSVKNVLCGQVDTAKNLEEIRLRCNKPIILKYSGYEEVLEYNINCREMLDILRKINR